MLLVLVKTMNIWINNKNYIQGIYKETPKNIHPCFHDFDVDMSTETNNIKFKIKLNILFPTEYKLYTDGSRRNEGVGCAV